MRTLVLHGSYMCEKQIAHEYLQKMLELPEHYGKNLDALYDCLTELSGVELLIIEQECDYWDRLKKVFLDAAKHNERIKVLFL